ncbi:MAG: energy-coupling factor transporter ATPase [Christensenellales bacterium]|jgi:energy-coupling factor transport system ATP-binding protein
MSAIISTENLIYEYRGAETSVRALDGVSVDIEEGSFTVILGHNGSGKSTLAKHFNALLTPTSGAVKVRDMDTSDHDSLWEIRKTCGMVFQNPDNQIVATMVEEDVAFGLENLGVPADEMRKRIDEALEAVRMSKFARSAPHRLSGGQKQRVAIAGIIAMRPDVIVLDEPTAMLDPRGRLEVMNTVKRLNKEEGMTIVHITHFMEEAAYADRVIVMNQGKVYMDGTPNEIFSRIREIKDVGLDAPALAEIADMLAGIGIDMPRLISVEEMVDRLCQLL